MALGYNGKSKRKAQEGMDKVAVPNMMAAVPNTNPPHHMDATFQKALGESLASLATRYENQGLSDRAAGVRDSIDVLAVICPKAAKAAKYYFQGDELREARNWDETPDTTERPPVDEAYEELQSCGN